MNFKKLWKKTWHFIWVEDSLASWLVNIILAFVLIKFIIYPALGFALNTNYPIVAVVSGSMEHDDNFDIFWEQNSNFYENFNITKQDFLEYKFSNGFNKGDIMILKGREPENINIGDIIVFNSGRPEPIIHRVIKKWNESNAYYFQTTGDHNTMSFNFETKIKQDSIFGNAVIRVPFLGWVKIGFVEFINLFR